MIERHNLRKYINPRILVPFIVKEMFTLTFGVTILSVYVVIICLSFPIYIYRYILSKVSPYLNHDLGKMVTARGQFLALENFTQGGKAPRSSIVAYLCIDGYVSVEQVREKLQRDLIEAVDDTRTLKYPETKQYVTSYMGYKYWKNDPKFSIENHVKIWSPQDSAKDECEGKNKIFTPNQVEDLVEVLINQTFEPERSPWEFILVNNVVNPEVNNGSVMTLLFLRFHHCLADGFGATFSLVGALCSQFPEVPKARYAQRRNVRLILFKLTYPFRVIRDMSKFIVTSFNDSPWKVRDDRKAWRQLCQSSVVFRIGMIKEIKNRFGVSFTSVVHSAIAAAMEKCLLAKYGIQKAKSMTKVPCVMVLPLPGHPLKLRNYCTGAAINLPTKSLDRIERLNQCEKEFAVIKKSTAPMFGQYLPVIVGSLFEWFAGVLGKNRAFPVSLSNFPIGVTPYNVCGNKVIHMTCIASPGVGVCGLGVVIHTYVDSLQFNFIGEQAVFSKDDLKLLANAVAEEIDELYNYVLV